MRPTAMEVLKSGGVGVVGEDEFNVKIRPKCGRVTGTGGGDVGPAARSCFTYGTRGGPERLQTHATAASSYIT